jgi:hypothetical protein
MAWGKVDDKLHSSPKWRATSKGGRALWATALSWSMDQLTDGFIPAHMLAALDGTRADAKSLVDTGLWERTEIGWQFHDWAEYQPSRDQVLAERGAAKERQKRARERARERRETEASRRDEGVTHGDVTPDVTGPPTRPDPTPKRTETPDGVSGPSAAAAGRPTKRGTRIPDPFPITAEMVAWARENAPGIDHRAVTERFVDYWRGISGTKGVKADWEATWRNWLRRESENRPAGRPSPTQAAMDVVAMAQQMQDQYERMGA